MMHSSTISGSTPARRTASATTSDPSCVAEKPLSAPRNFPVGVRTAPTITASRTAHLDPLNGLGAEQLLQSPEDDWGRPHHFARPLRARRLDEKDGAFELHLGRAAQ